jgi:hypothetical protein
MRDEKTSLSKETYQIKVEGKLDPKWRNWFDGFEILPLINNQTLLTGEVADQAALHGLLAKIRDLYLPLISVEKMDADVAN